MTEDFIRRVNGNERLVARARYLNTRFLLEVGADSYLISISGGRIASVVRGPFVMPSWSFAVRASAETWESFWKPMPEPGFHDVLALLKRRLLRIEGDMHPFMANLFYFKEVLATLGAGRPA